MESNFLIKSTAVNVIQISYNFFNKICVTKNELLNDFIIVFISPRSVLVCNLFFIKRIFTCKS